MAGTSHRRPNPCSETIRGGNADDRKRACEDQPIEELSTFPQQALEAEKDDSQRLGLLWHVFDVFFAFMKVRKS